MPLKNQAMLITYADSLGSNLNDLQKVLQGPLKDVVGGVHILPFFPSSGDRGFAPMDYTKVDPAFGSWADVNALAKDYYLMFDFMVNHISAQSPYFQDFLAKKDASEYADLFIRYKDFWPNGEPTEEQVDLIYKRKPRAPYRMAEFADGSAEKVAVAGGADFLPVARHLGAGAGAGGQKSGQRGGRSIAQGAGNIHGFPFRRPLKPIK